MEYIFKAMPRWLAERKLPDDCTPNRKKTIVRASHSYKLEGNEMYHMSLKYGNRLCILDQQRSHSVLKECHDNDGVHFGVNRTQSNVAKRYFWPSFSMDVRKWINDCDHCKKNISQQNSLAKYIGDGTRFYPHRFGFRPIFITERWDTLDMNIVGPLPQTQNGKKYILAITDLFSGYVKAFNMQSNSPEETSKNIIKIFYELGLPRRMITDQGARFVAQINELLGMTKVTTLSYSSTTDSDSGSNSCKIKAILTRLVDEHPYDWNQYLRGTLFEINTTKDSGMSYSPFDLMYFRKPRPFNDQEEGDQENGEQLATGLVVGINVDNVQLSDDRLNAGALMIGGRIDNGQFNDGQLNDVRFSGGRLTNERMKAVRLSDGQLNTLHLTELQLTNVQLDGEARNNSSNLGSLQFSDGQLNDMHLSSVQLDNSVQLSNSCQLNDSIQLNINYPDDNLQLINQPHRIIDASGLLNIGQLVNTIVDTRLAGNISQLSGGAQQQQHGVKLSFGDSNGGDLQLRLSGGSLQQFSVDPTNVPASIIHFTASSDSNINLINSLEVQHQQHQRRQSAAGDDRILINNGDHQRAQLVQTTSSDHPSSATVARPPPPPPVIDETRATTSLHSLSEARKIEAEYAKQVYAKRMKIKAFYVDCHLKRRAQTIIVGSKADGASKSTGGRAVSKLAVKRQHKAADWNGPFKNFLLNKYKFKT